MSYVQEKLNQETLIQKNKIISLWLCPGPQKMDVDTFCCMTYV